MAIVEIPISSWIKYKGTPSTCPDSEAKHEIQIGCWDSEMNKVDYLYTAQYLVRIEGGIIHLRVMDGKRIEYVRNGLYWRYVERA